MVMVICGLLPPFSGRVWTASRRRQASRSASWRRWVAVRGSLNACGLPGPLTADRTPLAPVSAVSPVAASVEAAVRGMWVQKAHRSLAHNGLSHGVNGRRA